MGGIKGRKQRRRLQRRLRAFDDHGRQPKRNPGKEYPVPMILHRPGSNNK